MIVALGLRANWRQFTLLVAVNGLVGAMVGLERSVMPVIARSEFHVASTASALAFIAAFGLAKALTNLASGWLADRHARRTTLLAGWLIAVPVPVLILAATSWWWIVAANVLLGVSQGLTWSMTVIMKIDLAGPRRRGLAMGLNEFAGYVAAGVAGIASGLTAQHLGLRAGAAYPGLIIAGAGLVLATFTRDTAAHVRLESVTSSPATPGGTTAALTLFSLSQAGFVNNLNDALAWGLFPLLFTGAGLTLPEMSVLAAIYPVTWGFAQLVAGPLSDRWGRTRPIVVGMVLQGATLLVMARVEGFQAWAVSLFALGIGTALVYPTLIAAVGDIARPSSRATVVGVYRFWRDLGYVAGAVVVGFLADRMGSSFAIAAVGVLTATSGCIVAARSGRLLRPGEHPPATGPAGSDFA